MGEAPLKCLFWDANNWVVKLMAVNKRYFFVIKICSIITNRTNLEKLGQYKSRYVSCRADTGFYLEH